MLCINLSYIELSKDRSAVIDKGFSSLQYSRAWPGPRRATPGPTGGFPRAGSCSLWASAVPRSPEVSRCWERLQVPGPSSRSSSSLLSKMNNYRAQIVYCYTKLLPSIVSPNFNGVQFSVYNCDC